MKVNQVLHLEVHAPGEETDSGKQRKYKARIADLSPDQIAIEVPIEEKTGRFALLEIGTQVSVEFKSAEGVKHYFDTEVTGRRTDAVPLIELRRPAAEEISRLQRRTFLRVPAALEVACKFREHLQFLAVTEDIGGGGLSIVCEGHLPLRTNDVLDCWLLIHFRSGAIEHVPFRAEIVRIKPQEDGNQLAMMRFAEIAEVEQQKVIRFCFEKQLEMRK